jgi:tRNA pseudouridine synthase 10
MEVVCGHCSKRIFGKEISDSEECSLCDGFFRRCEEICDRIVRKLRTLDFYTFNVGCVLDKRRLELEERLSEKVHKSLKTDINSALRACLKKRLGKKISFTNPDVLVLYNLETDDFEIQINPLYIYGVYKKFVRDLPQTKLFCYSCKGRGCEKCNYTGLEYPESVESIICAKVLEFTGGKECIFHGAGREDIDVRNLGGRPFVIEVKEPKVRHLDFEALEAEINKDGRIEVSGLRISSRREMAEITQAYHIKEYRALVECRGYEHLEVLEKTFHNTVIKQRTPLRVLRRRKDRWRLKRVYSVKVKPIDKNTFEMFIVSDPGLYIKEFITGDNGRTTPSVSEVLGKPCKVLELDVIRVGI